jgi:hypothetical protein
MTRRIRVEIDELVLHGFRPGDRDAIAAGLQAELTESLAGWAPGASRTAPLLDGGSFEMPTSTTPTTVGRGIGRQVRRNLSRGIS